MKLAIIGIHTILLYALAVGGPAHAEAVPASSGGPGEIVARLTWGTGAQAVGGGPPSHDQGGVLERVPASFFCDDSGAVHILDTPNRRIMLLKPGAAPAPVSLAALGEGAIAVDFAPRGKGWLVADQAANAVVEIGPDGAAGARWTGFQRLQRLDWSGDQVFARDETALTVSRLEAGGKVQGVSKSPHAVPVTSGGAPVLARVLAGHAVFAIKDAVFSLAAHETGDEVQGVEVAGTDAKGNLLLALHEGKGDERRGVFVMRITPDGEVQAEVRVPPCDELYTAPPRYYRAQSDGRVLTFRTDEAAYELSRLTLAPPGSPRKAVRAPADASAEDTARAALCEANAASARTAVAAAAIALAFDEVASRRVERDLVALDGGAAPTQLCALNAARAALEAGNAAKALETVKGVDAQAVQDRRLFIEAQALEKTDLRESLRRWQRIVLDHAASPHFAEANASVLRIVDSGKLLGAQPR